MRKGESSGAGKVGINYILFQGILYFFAPLQSFFFFSLYSSTSLFIVLPFEKGCSIPSNIDLIN